MASSKAKNRLEVSEARIQYSVNKWGARFIPAILVGLVGYSVWVIVVLIAINHLLRPPSNTPRRSGAGIAILVLYFLLLSLMSWSYIRMLQVVVTNPGFVPLPGTQRKRRRHHTSQSTNESTEKDSSHTPLQAIEYLDRSSVSNGRNGPPPGLERFYTRDIFECEVDGLPRWCSSCKNWKPDRSHHSREIGRCVYKMDHFCPWAGGIISETSFKFFVQFLVYGALWTLLVMIVSAYFIAEAHDDTGQYNINWIVVTALSGLFFLFAVGMGHSSLLAVFKNSTTVDNLSYRTRVHHFAVLIPPASATQAPSTLEASNNAPPTSQPASYTHTQVQSQTLSNALDSAPPPPPLHQLPPRPFATITYPLLSSSSVALSTNPRTFAILTTPTGTNPYKLPSALENFKTVMGERLWEWVLPVRYSPCWDGGHKGWFDYEVDGGRGGEGKKREEKRYMYRYGRVVEEMVKGAGLNMPGGGREGKRR